MGSRAINFFRTPLIIAAILLAAQVLAVVLLPSQFTAYAQDGNSGLPLIFNDLKPANEIINNESNVEFWEFFRGLINYVLVAVLIIVAFANVLRINLDTYSVKKALPSLIVGFVLANFSLFICQAILDLAQSLSVTALDTAEAVLGVDVGAAMFGGGFGTVLASVIALIIPAIAIGGPFGLIVGAIVAILLLFFPILVMIGFLVLFLVRNLVLQFLVVVAPLAFIAMGVPGVQGWFSKWWSYFTLWAFMKPVAYALLVFGALIIEAEIGGDIVAYVVGILVMAAAIYVPLNSGKLVFQPLSKYAGGFLGGRIRGGFNRIMTADFSSATRGGRAGLAVQNALGRTVYGFQALKQEEERRGRLAKARGTGEALGALRTRAAVGRQFTSGRYPVRSALSYVGLASPEWAGVRRTTHFRHIATAMEEAERAKELPDDPYRLMEVAAFTNDPIEKSVALKKISEKGLLSTYLDSYRDLITNAAGPVQDQLRLQAGVLAGQNIDPNAIRDSNLMQRFLAAQLGTLDEQRRLRQQLAAGGPAAHQGAIDSIQNNHYAVEQMAKISETMFQNGYYHLGSMAAPQVGRAPTLETDIATRNNINVGRVLRENEPQKLATSTHINAVLDRDPTQEMQEFFRQVASSQGFTRITPQISRLRPQVREALRTAALNIPNDATGRPMQRLDRATPLAPLGANPEDDAYADFIRALRSAT